MSADRPGAGSVGSPGLLQRPVRWWRARSNAAQDRPVGAVLALPTGAVLGIAGWLTPAAEGVGTHKQLGLGGCTVLSLTGYPCPMCGMTTTFTHMAHLSPLDALVTQPFGVVLFLATLSLFVIGAADLIAARGLWRRLLAWVDRHEVRLAAGLLGGLGAGWIYKLAVMEGWLTLSP